MNTTNTTDKLRIDVWSDIACPWCYVGKRRLEGALAGFAHRDQVEVVWRAFELDPSAPRVQPATGSYAERIARKYGSSVAQAEERMRSLTELAARDGLTFRFDRIRPGNTFDAHRLLHLAHDRGVQGALKERMLRAYLSEGEAIGDPEVLARLSVDAGLSGDEAWAVLKGDAYRAEVRADEAEAAELGIHGVPFFALAGRYGVSGAQPVEALARVLDRVWAERAPVAPELVEGAVCGPDGCA